MSSGSSIIIRYRSPSRINAMGQTKALARTARTAGPFVDGGLLAKERQEKRFTSAGIVIREKRRVPVLPECPQYGKSRFPVPDDVRPMRRAQPRGDVIHQLVFIRPHDRQARMVGYIPKQAGQQLPSPEMCRCYHAGALNAINKGSFFMCISFLWLFPASFPAVLSDFTRGIMTDFLVL